LPFSRAGSRAGPTGSRGIGLLLALAFLGTGGVGRTFFDLPPTRGLYLPTAYTLSRGETQVQFFAFTSPTNPLEFFAFEYGLSNAFMLGARPISALFGDIRIWGKYHVGTAEAVSLAIPFGVNVLVPAPAWSVHGGWVLSWRVLPFLTLHPGLDMAFSPGMVLRPHLGLDLDLWTNLKLVVEVDGEEPYVTAGLLARVMGFVQLQVDTPLPTVRLRVSVSGRF